MTLSRFRHSRFLAASSFTTCLLGLLASSSILAASVQTGGSENVSPLVAPPVVAPPVAAPPVAAPPASASPIPAIPAASNTEAVTADLLPPTSNVSSPVPAPASTSTPVAPTIDNPGRPAPTQSAATAAVASAGSLTQVALVLVLVVGLIAAVAWLLRKLGVARPLGGTTIRVVSGINLSNRERILVVEIADQWLVVGVSPGRINTLATMPRQDGPNKVASSTGGFEAPVGKNFAQWLKQTMDKRNGAANER